MVIGNELFLGGAAAQWEQTARQSPLALDRLFGSHACVRAWYQTLTTPDNVLCVGALEPHGQAAPFWLPLVRRHRIRQKIRSLETITNDDMWYAPVLGHAGAHEAVAAINDLAALQEWDQIIFQHVDMARPFWRAVPEICTAHGFRVLVYPTMHVGTATLSENVSEYLSHLEGDFRRELKRRMRHLEQKEGPLTVSCVTAPEEAEAAFYEGFGLELKGWKSFAQSAVLQKRSSGEYFKVLAHAAAARQSLALIIMRTEKHALSFHFCLHMGDDAFLMKTAYHEEFARYGAGQLGAWHAIEALGHIGVKRLNFFGQYVPWHTPWQPNIAHYSKIVVMRQGLKRTGAFIPYWAYARLKEHRLLFRMVKWHQKWWHILRAVNDVIRNLSRHLR